MCTRALARRIGTALALCATACGGGAEEPTNLLFVIFDTTRADHLGCYGYERTVTSPTVDELARAGTLLENVYAQSSLTPVSAGSFLTGTLPYVHGIRSLFVVGEGSLSPDVPTLAETLAQSGRQTAGFVSAKPMGSQYGFARGFEVWDDDLTETRERYAIARFADAAQRPAEETTDRALAWLDENGRDPFACLVHFYDAHDPSFVPPRDFLAPRLSYRLPDDVERMWSYEGVGNMERLIELYDAEILWMDRQLERLLAKLAELGVRDDTLIVFLADHGESFGEHGYFTHGWLSEEQIRIPIVLSGPGLPAGRRVDARLRSIDLFPTLAELFDLPLAASRVDGRSALSLVLGTAESEVPERPVYAEVRHSEQDPRDREAAMHTLIEGSWKYVHRPVTRAHELYDLASDPAESKNLFEAEPERAVQFTAALLDRGALGGDAVSLEGMTPEQLDELRALGYLGSDEDADEGTDG